MKKNKIPLRTCIGCSVIRPKRELVRVIVLEDNVLKIDPTGKEKGRGAYLCRCEEEIKKIQSGELQPKEDNIFTISKDCKEKAIEKNAFSRAFRKKLSKELEIQG